jgi:hypothetical protein
MRYYSIVITPNPIVGQAFEPITYTTIGFLGDNYSALQVDLDIYQAQSHTPAPLGSINIYGISFGDINQTTYLPGANIQVFVGMTTGLPFADPSQIGLIVEGTILQAFGNWQGTNVCLSLIITSGSNVPSNSINLPLDWKKGQTLDEAVKETLEIGYIGETVTGTYSQNLKTPEDQYAIYDDLKTFANYINSVSKTIIPDPSYSGACIVPTPEGFKLYDSFAPQVQSTLINYVDLVGNITWLNVATISVKVVMRADLEVGNYISFPALAPVVNTATFAQYRNTVSFDGVFQITKLRHQGSSRQATGDSWVTIIEAVAINEPLYINLDPQ